MAGTASPNPLPLAAAEEEDDDAISVTSTLESEYDPDKEFIVTRILAQKGSAKTRLFLIQWQDYPLDKATWEPRNQISPEILDQWDLRQKEEKRGLKPAFDLKAWQAQADMATKQKEKRKKLRRALRKKLGIPVQMSDHDEDVSSDEAMEENEIEDEPVTKSSKARTVTPLKPIKKPARFIINGTNAQRLEDPSSDSDANGSKNSKVSGNPSWDGTTLSKAKELLPKPRQTPLHIRTASDSSSDAPIAQKRRKLTGQGLPTLRKSEQAKSKARESDFSKSNLTKPEVEEKAVPDEPSRSLQQEPKTLSNDSPMSPETPSLFMDESLPVETEKKSRGRPSTRGKIATRGGAAAGTSALRKNVFETGESTKLRGRKPGDNLLKLATDSSKNPKVASNRHIMRKLELQARDVAEGAPDISAIGGLFDPSNMSSVEPVRPSTLRKSSSSVSVFYNQAKSGAADFPDLFEDEEAKPLSPVTPQSITTRPTSSKPVCFFWNRAEKNKKLQSCAKGYLCDYLHRYEFGASVAPPPPGFLDVPEDGDSQDEGARNYDDYYTSVCYFWDRAQKDSSQSSCSKGASCKFLHSYNAGVPIAPPPPPAYAPDDAESDHDISVESPRREKRSESPSAKVASSEPTVPPWRNKSGPIPAPQPATSMHTSPTEVFAAQRTQKRPPWNPFKGNDAICYFWWENGSCTRGDNCKLYHSNDIRLPIAPSRFEQQQIMGRLTCPRWLQGICRFGDECAFAHIRHPSMPELPNDYYSSATHSPFSRSIDPPTSRLDGSPSTRLDGPSPSKLNETVSSTSTEPPKKAVKFLLEEPDKVFDEPAKISPANEAREVRQYGKSKDKRKTIPCRYMRDKGYCNSGSRCAFFHDTHIKHPEHEDMEMSNTAQHDEFTGYRNTPSIPMRSTVPERMQNASVLMEADGLYAQSADSAILPEATIKDTAAKGPRKKVNLAQYNQQKARKKIGARAKTVYFGENESEPVILDFGDIETAEDSPWKREFPDIDKVTFSQICMAQDFEVQKGYLQRRGIFRGSLVPADVYNQEVAKIIEKVADELVTRSAGLLAPFPKFAILLFPASKEEWKYLEASSDCSKDAWLKYFVFETDWDINQLQNNEIKGMNFGEPYRRLLVNMIHGLDLKRLLPQVGPTEDAHKFFLLFPPAASHISAFLATWLIEKNNEAKVYDSQKDGSWDYFRKTFSTGVVLVHETAAASLHLLPSLFEVLAKRNFSFWSISSGDTVYPPFPSRYCEMDRSSLGQITATRLFPQGCAMLFTPSFIVAEPARAYGLVKTFREKLSTAIPGTWKLVCAGNICNYLLDLAISKVNEKDALEAENRNIPAKDAILNDAGLSFAHCEARNKLHTLFTRLEVKGLLDSPIDSDGPSFQHGFHQENDHHIVQADMFIDPDDEPALIKWFAAWSMRNLDVHRKFIVVGTGSASAPRAHRMKETVTVPGLDTPPDENMDLEGAKALDSAFQPFSVKGISPTKGSGMFIAEAKRKALAIAAKLSALRPEEPTAAAPAVAQENPMNKQPLTFTSRQSVGSTKHGINESLPTAQLHFCSITGGTVDEAATFLARSNNDLKLAIELYNRGDMDLDTQIHELIASATEKHSPAPLRILTAENDLARAMELVDVTSSDLTISASDAIRSARLAQYDGPSDAYSPQYDGTNDRPGSSGSTSTTRSGIATNEQGQRFVPRSVRLDNSIRKEISVRPGFVPDDDVPRYVSPGVAASRGATGSRTASMQNSTPTTPTRGPDAGTPPVKQLQNPDRMAIDGGEKEISAQMGGDSTINTPAISGQGVATGSGVDGGVPKKPNTELRKHIFKDTVTWYEEYKRTNGSGWEHIFIGAHDDAIRKSGIATSK